MNEQKDIIVKKRNFEKKKGEGLNSESHKITFGEKLQETLEDKKMSIPELAKLIGRNEKAVQDYIDNKTKPRMKTMYKIEKTLDISFEEYHPVLGENMTFGQELNLVLADKDIAIKEFADELDISKETLYAYIHAEGIPNIKIIHLMEEKLDVSFYKYYSKIIKGNTLGETLKYLLKYKGICKKKFAKSLHISKSTLYSYMENRSKPGIATIHQMGKILDYSFAEYY